MSKTSDPVVVNWYLQHGSDKKFLFFEGAVQEPEPLYKYVQRIKGQQTRQVHYTKCYAFIDFCNNAFVYKSPTNLRLTVDPVTRTATTYNFDQQFFDENITYRDWDNGCGITIGPAVVFYSDESVIMELLPLMIASSPANKNVSVVPGRMDIGKAIRPIDFTGEIINPDEPVEIKHGDPLFIIRFITKDNRPVQFNRTIQQEHHVFAVDATTGYKKCKEKTPLPKLYEALDPILRVLGFKKKIEKD